MVENPDASSSAKKDQLGVDPSRNSLLVCNYGDAAFLRETPFHPDLLQDEVIFLRLIAYLAFIDEIAIPARLILDSEPLMRAVDLATPLLRVGIVRPERRWNIGSFSELAVTRGLGELGRDRADRLDKISHNPRVFRFDDLQRVYKTILVNDLRAGGAFRRTIKGGQKGKRASLLDAAYDDYGVAGDGTPENFAAIVGKHASELQRSALKWAMARYYSTPALFDSQNLREIPRPAAELLLSSKVKEEMSLPEPTLAPAELMFQRLTMSLPAHQVRLNAERYCDSIMALRERIPEARAASRSVLTRSEANAVSREVSAEFEAELTRQQEVSAPGHMKFVLGTALIGGLAGGVIDIFTGMPFVGSTLLSLGTGAGAELHMKRSDKSHLIREAPWIVAVDTMDEINKRR
jgi:hypothetical protein